MDAELRLELEHRLGINEGVRLTPYRDTMGILTVGIGYNLQQGGAVEHLHAVGVDNPASVVLGNGRITQEQAYALFNLILPGYIDVARESLSSGIFDTLGNRQIPVCDLVYNLGQRGWQGFTGTRALINEAQAAKNAGNAHKAHILFGIAADHLRASAWDGQVHDRAKRDEAILRTSLLCDAYGDGSDVL